MTDQESTLRCVSCDSPLAHDQRYCIECGSRRGPLPSHVRDVIEGGTPPQRPPASESGEPVEPLPGDAPQDSLVADAGAGPAAEAGDGPAGEPGALPEDETEPVSGLALIGGHSASPRAVAVAVLAMLAFGVVVGSFAGSGGISLASARRLLIRVQHEFGSTRSQPSSSGGGGGGGTITQVSTSTSPSAPSPAGDSGSGGSDSGGDSGTSTGGNNNNASTDFVGLPPVKHVFLIVLSDQGFAQTFSPASPDHYLSKTLPKQGELLEDYYAVTTGSLANEIALISGQGPTVQTNADCPTFAALSPGTTTARYHQVAGAGCVYPKDTPTIASQLIAKHDTWKAYIEGIDATPRPQTKACSHPALGAVDADQVPRAHDPYVTWSNPFVYFRSLTKGHSCAKLDVGLGQLATDLKAESTTPSLTYIVPSPCDDGSDTPCTKHAPAGLAAADKFLKKIVPEIESSPAYKANGLIAITFDHAPQTGPHADASACCENPVFPNLPAVTATTPTSTTPAAGTTTPSTTTTTPLTTPSTTTPTTTTPTTPTTSTPTTTTPTTTTPTTTVPNTTGGSTSTTGGGGQVGLLLISPYVKPGTTDVFDTYNHFALLGSLEKLFKLKRLGYAADPNLLVFDSSVYNINASG